MSASSRSQPAAIPTATYRLQLGGAFPFARAAGLAGYLRALGISHCYASPILASRPGSAHGYDGLDPTRLDEELGGEAGFAAWHAALRSAGLGLLLDIVPNHLCVVGGGNPWWQDVLTHGQGSRFAHCFDIDWQVPDAELAGRVLLPLLGRPLPEVLAAGELRLLAEPAGLHVAYFEHRWPLSPASWPLVLGPLLQRGGRPGGAAGLTPQARRDLRVLLVALRGFLPPARLTRRLVPAREAAWAGLPERLAALGTAHSALRAALEAELESWRGEALREPAGGRWAALLDAQAWRLAHWRTGNARLNYRRFFDVTELAGLRQEDARVFVASHAKVLELAAAGAVHGLRIDHPDGLADPTGYLRRLRRAFQGALARARQRAEPGAAGLPAEGYLIVEKILEPRERRRGDWPVQGGTGYDMLYRLNALQVDTAQAEAFRAGYRRCTGDADAFEEHVHTGKQAVLRGPLAAEVTRVTRELLRLASRGDSPPAGPPLDLRAVPEAAWRAALEALAACLPVYRTYVARGGPASAEDRHWLALARADALRRYPALDAARLDWLLALLQHPAAVLPRARRAAQAFVSRFQQLTGAVMAKGLEDTAFYRHVPLISLNEVGGNPAAFGIGREEFHAWNRSRARRWPHALSATATHDTKRGEGVRARLNALSERPAAWEAAFRRWQALNARHALPVASGSVPDPAAEYLLYQTLVGAWPLGGRHDAEWPGFAARIAAYLLKAVREAKRHTSWIDPQPDYEQALERFVARVLAPDADNAFPDDMEAFLAPLRWAGLYNALGQTLLKLALPGVPDFYQGTELWDFSLVDPDNRRPVDFARRAALLAELPHPPTPAAAAALLAEAPDGRIKLHTIRQGLALRARHAALFEGSDYRPLEPLGERERHVVAFARTRGSAAVLAVTGRFFLGLPGLNEAAAGRAGPPAPPVGAAVWGDTMLQGPPGLPGGPYRDVLTGRDHHPRRTAGRLLFPVGEVLAHLPVALLERAA